MQANIVRTWLTYKEAEHLVGLSRTTLWKLISASEIEHRKVGRAVRISRESLEAYMSGDADGTGESGCGESYLGWPTDKARDRGAVH
jgi:excisionase family DNA binding protein